MIKFYCDCCGLHQPVIVEELIDDELNPDTAWGDIVCKVCHFVIATISTDLDKKGKYEFVRVEDGIPQVTT